VGLITILLEHEQICTSEERSYLDLKVIADRLQMNTSAEPMNSDAELMATLDSTDWDDLMQWLDMTFGGPSG
jgi:hypothetical protein